MCVRVYTFVGGLWVTFPEQIPPGLLPCRSTGPDKVLPKVLLHLKLGPERSTRLK